jgi:UDP-N-acetylglucosamine--N-acetylmuramyl-(pentapeptide) pyrophosphoryl-undecaprenol N-acetylglucosamine transferase
MIPAHRLAAELKGRGHGVLLITDERGSRFPGLFEDVPVHILPAGRLGGGPIGLIKALGAVVKGRGEAKRLYREHTPDAVVGFGGYPAFPSLLAASSMNIPTVIHEQNAVLGRVNRLLAGESEAIGTAYDQVDRLKPRYAERTVLIGNPVRAEITRLGELPFPAFDEVAPLKILVTGGSQGASVLSKVVPEGLGLLDPSLRRRLQVVQQCRPEDIERVKAAYGALDIAFELASFFADMPQRFADAQLIICRSGASTIAELGIIGRPAIMVPLPHSLDNDQLHNAEFFAGGGGGWVRPQADLDPQEFAAFLTRLRYQDDELAGAARAALAQGMPDAAERLADLVEDLAHHARNTETTTK